MLIEEGGDVGALCRNRSLRVHRTEHGPELLMRLGRSEEAHRMAKLAVELDPVSPAAHNDAGVMYYYTGQVEMGAKKFEEALQLAPGHPALLANLALARSSQNRHEEAIRLAEQGVAAAPDLPFGLAVLGYAQARGEQRASAEQSLARLQSLPQVPPYLEAMVHAGLGNREQAARLLEQAVEKRDAFVLDLGVVPMFADYRDEPRVRRLLRKMGLD